MSVPRSLRYQDGVLVLLDQRALPGATREVTCSTVDDVVSAIRDMVVRGAPAIGVAGAYGVVLGARAAQPREREAVGRAALDACARLRDARPTAVNLHAALRRMSDVVGDHDGSVGAEQLTTALQSEAAALEMFEVQASRAMGLYAAQLLPDGARVYVHCNTGALATVGRGTALAAVFDLHDRGQLQMVFVGETRPRLQGARLTAYELAEAGIAHVLVVDSLAPTLMLHRAVDAVLVGADRIAANGDVANKVGTYALAVACAHHSVPLYVVAPTTSVDADCESGADIPIEERAADEITGSGAQRSAPTATRALNPAFDITPASLVTALVTERGVVAPLSATSLAEHLGSPP